MSAGRMLAWLPAVVLAAGAVLTLGIGTQRALPLRAPLAATVPTVIEGYVGEDHEISEAERRVAAMSDYLYRIYNPAPDGDGGSAPYTVLIAYYDSQTQGRTIHSPKNCLPGSGWEALASQRAEIATPAGPVTVNRYLIQNKEERALVLYWYQGRGRVEASEYAVKWDLLRDAALRRRSEEALVRIVVPLSGSEDEAFALASRVAGTIVPAVYAALPDHHAAPRLAATAS